MRMTTRVRTQKMVCHQDAIIVYIARSLMTSHTNAGLPPSHQSQKRKRSAARLVTDAQSVVEVDDLVDDDILPRIQNPSNRPICYATPLVQSDPPATTPHHSPSPPRSILSAEDKTTRHDKPTPKLTVKALRNAKAEVHWFVH